MNRRGSFLLLAGVLAAAIAAVAALYRLRLGQGDGFAPYSSLRADPLGLRVLHDSLALLPEVTVSRRFEPLDDLPAEPPRTLVLAGLDENDLTAMPATEFQRLDAAVRSGSRLVLALRASHRFDVKAAKDDAEKPAAEKTDAKKSEAGKSTGGPVKAEKAKKTSPVERIDAGARWEVALRHQWMVGPAERNVYAGRGLPDVVKSGSNTWFEPAHPFVWQTLYTRGSHPVVIERSQGRGTIVLMADAYPLSNEALQRERATAFLLWTIGPHRTVEFDESHLGVLEERGLATLARGYGLGASAFSFALLALLYFWRNLAVFAPPSPEDPEVRLRYQQTAGLESLLRRAIVPAGLAATALTEWRRTAAPRDIAKAEAATAALPQGAPPAAAYNAIVRALRRR